MNTTTKENADWQIKPCYQLTQEQKDLIAPFTGRINSMTNHSEQDRLKIERLYYQICGENNAMYDVFKKMELVWQSSPNQRIKVFERKGIILLWLLGRHEGSFYRTHKEMAKMLFRNIAVSSEAYLMFLREIYEETNPHDEIKKQKLSNSLKLEIADDIAEAITNHFSNIVGIPNDPEHEEISSFYQVALEEAEDVLVKYFHVEEI